MAEVTSVFRSTRYVKESSHPTATSLPFPVSTQSQYFLAGNYVIDFPKNQKAGSFNMKSELTYLEN